MVTLVVISEFADITYHESMQIIVEAMLATEFHIADAQLEAFYAKFLLRFLSEGSFHLQHPQAVRQFLDARQ